MEHRSNTDSPSDRALRGTLDQRRAYFEWVGHADILDLLAYLIADGREEHACFK